MTDKFDMTRRQLLRTVGAGLALSAPSIAPLGAAADRLPQIPIGMNLAGVADWEPGFPFLNLMWGSRVWLTRSVSGQGSYDSGLAGVMEMDADGYPLEVPFRPDATTPPQYAITLLPNRLTAGKYVVLYDGDGVIGVEGATKFVAARPGRVEIGMRHGGSDAHLEGLSIRRSTRGNHVRNIRVLPIAHEHVDLARNPFRPELIEFCRPWHCLRFMDWLGTNESTQRTWSGRKRRSFYTQVGASGDALGMFGQPLPAGRLKWSSGIAIELCIELANLTRTDAWLCVPHMADDDYIRQMAQLVKNTLDPTLKVYVEFSNEIWNWQFMQAHWMLRSEVAGDLVAAAGGRPPWKDGVRPPRFQDGIVAPGAGEGIDHPERTGALFRRCFKIWEEVFQGADRRRLVRVCAVQAAWYDTVRRTLGWVMKNGGCDLLSPTGYFGPSEQIYKGWEAAGAGLTADRVIAEMGPAVEEEAARIGVLAGIAKSAGVRLAVYEGGQHIQPEHQEEKPYNPALGAAQKHPGMHTLYRRLLDAHAKAGVDLFCAFSSVGSQGARWGSWGHVEHYGQDKAEMPKYRALLEANPPRGAASPAGPNRG